ncbi:MAG: cadherin-like domain-containing protein, partial [Pirellulaceae bacterium]
MVTTLRNGSIGVLWSNQVDDRFYFREHRDFDDQGQRNDPANWEPLEIPAENAAQDVGGGIADDHLNVAVAANGTLYAGVKTSYDRSGYTEIGAIVRRPNGLWDQELYHASSNGTRPIIVLNDTLGQLMVIYGSTYRESLTDAISFGSGGSLPLGSNVTSTKQNWVDELVILGGGKAVLITTDAIVNKPPVAMNDTYNVNEDQMLTVTAAGVLDNDTDPDGNSLTSALVSGPANGTLDLSSDGSFTYTPNSNYNGADRFTYNASDGVNTAVVATVSISVDPVNDAPVASGRNYMTEVDKALSITLVAVDIDGDGLTYTISNPLNGTLTGTAPNLTYTPNGSFTGSDRFTFRVNDGTVDSDTATVAIEVRSNSAPVA